MSKKIFIIFIYIFAIIGLVLSVGFLISKLNLTKNGGMAQSENYFDTSRMLINNETFDWMHTDEYTTLKAIMPKEKDTLLKVENGTGIKSRLLASILFVEQMRLYNSNTELFKKIFQPLQILGVQSQYSWGVLGLKQDTLVQIENNLKTATSTFYLGSQYEHLLDFSTATDHDAERFNRVTDEHDHYYTYLYAALFIKQIEKQWSDAGFDISGNPEILATLYNIGFAHSTPNNNPQVGGAAIQIGNTSYSFGELAYEFYYSNELINVFPR
jgi:Protein of unknown function (DUF1402)